MARQEQVYVCPKCGHVQGVFVNVNEIVHALCPRRLPRTAAPKYERVR